MSGFSFRLGDGTTLRAEADYETYQTMGGRGFDPEWSGYDENGHFHVAVKTSKGYVTHPTLKELWRVGYCDTCRDRHEEGDLSDGFECRFCHAEVVPGTKYFPPQQMSWLRQVTYTREGWIWVQDRAQAEELTRSGYVDNFSGALHSGYKVHILEHLTKEQFDQYLLEVQQARSARDE